MVMVKIKIMLIIMSMMITIYIKLTSRILLYTNNNNKLINELIQMSYKFAVPIHVDCFDILTINNINKMKPILQVKVTWTTSRVSFTETFQKKNFGFRVKKKFVKNIQVLK